MLRLQRHLLLQQGLSEVWLELAQNDLQGAGQPADQTCWRRSEIRSGILLSAGQQQGHNDLRKSAI